MKRSDESMEFGEVPRGGSPVQDGSYLTLQKAVEFGEYNPEKLATYPEWHKLSRHAQFELIKRALNNRNRQLWVKWA